MAKKHGEEVTTAEAVKQTPAQSIEIEHSWRRDAVLSAVQRLWNAAELYRSKTTEADPNRIVSQRLAVQSLASQLLGKDAPVFPNNDGF